MFRFLSSLFRGQKTGDGSTAPASVQHRESYKGYQIQVAPLRENGRFRVGARIYRDDNPESVHQLVRADEFPTLDDATEHSLVKAKQAIDQLGERLFRES